MANDKLGVIGIVAILALAVVAIGAADNMGWINLGATTEEPISTEPGDTANIRDYPEKCDLNPTLTYGPAKKKWAPGTSVAGENHRVYFSGVDQGLKLDSSTGTPGYYNLIDIYYAENSSTYLSTHEQFRMPCRSLTTAEVNDLPLHELIALDINPVINCFNSDTGNLNTVDDNETINANDRGKFTCTIDGDSYEGWNNGETGKGEVTMVITANKTAYQEGKTTVGGGWISSTYIPASHSYNYTAQVAKAYKKTIPMDQNGVYEEFNIEVFSETSHNPGLGGGDLRIDFYFPNNWRHSVTAEMDYGYETDLNALAAPGTTASVVEKLLIVT